MLAIILVMTTDSLANVKANFSGYIDEVHRSHERVEITRNGVPAAVLISPDDLDSLEETIAILSDPDIRRAVRQGIDDIREGDVHPWGALPQPSGEELARQEAYEQGRRDALAHQSDEASNHE